MLLLMLTWFITRKNYLSVMMLSMSYVWKFYVDIGLFLRQNNKGKGRLKYLLQQTELFAHFAKGDQSASQKKGRGR